MMNRKTLIIFLLIITCLTLKNNPVTGGATNEKRIGKVTFVLGGANDVQIQHKNLNVWQSIKLTSSIYREDKIKTAAESRCEVTLDDKSIIRIGENTVFCFVESSIDDYKKSVRSELLQGRVWLNVNKSSKPADEFQIKTPTAVCAVRGTIYRIDSDSSTTCLVYDGKVDVGPLQNWGNQPPVPTNSLQPVEVPGPFEVPPPYEVSLETWVQIIQGFQIVVRPDGKYAKSKFDEAKDATLDWVVWNKERDINAEK
ncbi:MAG TPA: FecR family protein [bacterium]|nr:FecR family protein [bacterium]HPN45416.1 FecR family protein [bacterium]